MIHKFFQKTSKKVKHVYKKFSFSLDPDLLNLPLDFAYDFQGDHQDAEYRRREYRRSILTLIV